MSELVDIREHQLPEARRTRELRAALFTMRYVGLPAVVVRASGLVDTGASSHVEIAQAVSGILRENPKLGWRPLDQGAPIGFIGKKKGRGDLHHDSYGLNPKFRIQRTNGSGKVWMAVAGKLGFDFPDEFENNADLDFQGGKVDPRFISADFYVTELDNEDNVIFPLAFPLDHNKPGPIWHAFDTSSTRRRGIVISIPLADCR